MSAPKYSSNPFLEQSEESHEQAFVSEDKAVLTKMARKKRGPVLLIGKETQVREKELIDILVDEMSELFGINKKSQRVLAYLLSLVDGEDQFTLDIKDCLAKTGYSVRTSVYMALNELLDKGFIARTEQRGVYWLNTKRLYNPYKANSLVVIKRYTKV